MKRKVSICIPAYNNEQHIADTIESILNQTYTELTLVIVDDCSTDKTVEVIQSFQDERVELIRNEKNLGMSGNWNKCVSQCNSEYVKLICADDILVPTCVEREIFLMEQDETIVMTTSDSSLIDDQQIRLGIFPRYYSQGIIEGEKLAKKSLIGMNYFGMPCAVMFRKRIFDMVGGFDSYFQYILDFDVWTRIACEGNVYVIKEELNQFRLRRESNTGKVFTTDRKAYYIEHKYLLNKYREKLSINRMQYGMSLLSRQIRNHVNSIYLWFVIRGYLGKN